MRTRYLQTHRIQLRGKGLEADAVGHVAVGGVGQTAPHHTAGTHHPEDGRIGTGTEIAGIIWGGGGLVQAVLYLIIRITSRGN